MSDYCCNMLFPGPIRPVQAKQIEYYHNADAGEDVYVFLSGEYLVLIDVSSEAIICQPLKIDKNVPNAKQHKCSHLVELGLAFGDVKTSMDLGVYREIVRIFKALFSEKKPQFYAGRDGSYYSTSGSMKIAYKSKYKAAVVEQFILEAPGTRGGDGVQPVKFDLNTKLRNTVLLFQDMMGSRLRTQLTCERI